MKQFLKSSLLGLALTLAFASAQAKSPASASAAASVATAASASAKAELMDLNTATKEELATLPKIGDVRAEAIVKGRPYSGKDDLLKKKVIPADAYKSIKDLVIAKKMAK